MHAQLSLRLCGVPENLNLSGSDLGSARNTGPALVPLQSNLGPEQCRRGKRTCRERGKPSVAQTPRARPTLASDALLQSSSFPTARLSK